MPPPPALRDTHPAEAADNTSGISAALQQMFLGALLMCQARRDEILVSAILILSHIT